VEEKGIILKEVGYEGLKINQVYPRMLDHQGFTMLKSCIH
jgi:hypothetical protein